MKRVVHGVYQLVQFDRQEMIDKLNKTPDKEA